MPNEFHSIPFHDTKENGSVDIPPPPSRPTPRIPSSLFFPSCLGGRVGGEDRKAGGGGGERRNVECELEEFEHKGSEIE